MLVATEMYNMIDISHIISYNLVDMKNILMAIIFQINYVITESA